MEGSIKKKPPSPYTVSAHNKKPPKKHTGLGLTLHWAVYWQGTGEMFNDS